MKSQKLRDMEELIKTLNEASKSYYQYSKEIMDNFTYDKLFDELKQLESETGVIYGNSPTQNVGYEIVGELHKVKHETRMLSLDKTKELSTLQSFLGQNLGILSFKMDGLTIVLDYENGELKKAITRGNGEVGEDITNNALTFSNIPKTIPCKEKITIRGEAVISYDNFNKINAVLPIDDKYKNPRNLASGSVRQLNTKKASERHLDFVAFQVVSEHDFTSTVKESFAFLMGQGFDVVKHFVVDRNSVEAAIKKFTEIVEEYIYAVDGLVLTFDNIGYGKSLGSTSHHPNHSIAFKWQDETAKTTLREIQWQTSRTGLINPVAIFDPVELEGTTVTKASVHNLSIMKDLKLGIGDTISVFKANMIIPQIAENFTQSNTIEIPKLCPVCGYYTSVEQPNDTIVLMCTNPNCKAKLIKKFAHYTSRDCMNIEGLSEATLEKFIDKGFLKEIIDLYYLEQYRDKIINMNGFGVKSYNKLITNIEASRTNVSIPNFIKALGIDGIGKSVGKLIAEYYEYNIDIIFTWYSRMKIDLMSIEGIGESTAKSFIDFVITEGDMVDELMAILDFEVPSVSNSDQSLEGKTFVVTGKVNHFNNRKELQTKIEELGGKVSGSVSKNTSYLINNDVKSTSGKNKKANELGVKIISENEFLEMIGDEL